MNKKEKKQVRKKWKSLMDKFKNNEIRLSNGNNKRLADRGNSDSAEKE